jgi:endo-1,4-beta-xylanase
LPIKESRNHSNRLFRFLYATAFLLAAVHNSNGQPNSPQNYVSLKEKFQNDFLIGVAMNTAQIPEKDTVEDQFIQQQFSAATPENIMKAEIIHPAWNRFDFEMADKLIAFGER